jgi:sterol desaturase/sphingolipid hydroxylase (fatty acid hydroxylase superfamily)
MATLRLVFIYSVPVVIALATLEALIRSSRKRGAYDWRAYFASLTDLLVRQYLVYTLLPLGLADPVIAWAWTHRLATVPLDAFGAFVLLFLGQEFCYYWFHRCSHRVRWLWATHAVHHSPNQLTLAAAYRFGWTGRLSGTGMFFVPLVWLGFPPPVVFATLSLNLLYQFWLHVDWIPKLGPLEFVFNTPSHHRVHHAANAEYLDANYGGVLIIFDRLFGTLRVERDELPCRYGLVEPLRSNNPVRIAFHEWIALARDLWAVRNWRDGWRALFSPPSLALRHQPAGGYRRVPRLSTPRGFPG